MTTYHFDPRCLNAARVLLSDQFCVQPNESIVITVDNESDSELVKALTSTAAGLGAKVCVTSFAKLPLQGALADPYIPDSVEAAVVNSDVWLDLAFPYMAGSGAFDRAMQHKRTRYLLLGDLSAAGFGRLYGSVDFDALFELQLAADKLFSDAEGSRCRIASAQGTDISFVMGPPATRKYRHATQPGAQTVPGSAIFYPELDTVQGTIVLDAVFHEYYTSLSKPLSLVVDGKIRSVEGDGMTQVMDRSLRRAGGGEYGHVIHLSMGLHPYAINTGNSFIENIRSVGCNAIGLGLPWWIPGGGENHPDGVVKDQSIWIEGEQIVSGGLPVKGSSIARPFDVLADVASAR